MADWNNILEAFNTGSNYYKLLRHERLRYELLNLQQTVSEKEKEEFLVLMGDVINNYVEGRIDAKNTALRINEVRKVISINFREGLSFSILLEDGKVYTMPNALKGSFEQRKGRAESELTKSQRLVVELEKITRINSNNPKNVIISSNRTIASKHRK